MIFNKKKSNILFSGDDLFFKDLASRSSCYFEYGGGESTCWVLSNSKATVVTVDTSRSWLKEIERSVDFDILRWRPIHVNVGDLEEWGRPVGFKFRSRFLYYACAPWRTRLEPDFILIDGRFRVCCFLASLVSARPGTIIIFDDYVDRSQYHVCEEFLRPIDTIGRQAIFEVPKKFDDTSGIYDEMHKFSYVID